MRAILLLALPVALAACQQGPKDASTESGTAGPSAESDVQTDPAAPPVSATPAGEAQPSHTPPAIDGIPAALQGRWGMVPADCTSTRGDAKGLLTITPTTLKFYESVGELATIKDRSDRTIHGDFSFSGEGMTWNREETLSVAGDKLTRTERGGDEPGSGGPFTYTRC